MFWWWYALLSWTIDAGWLKAPTSAGGGAVLLMWSVFTFLLWLIFFY